LVISDIFYIFAKNKQKSNKNMASKNVLAEAITKLVNANAALREKIHTLSDKKKADECLKEITRNEAMILDYKFRLEYDE
jgi:cell division protein FtsB